MSPRPRKPTRAVQLGVTDDDYARMLADRQGEGEGEGEAEARGDAVLSALTLTVYGVPQPAGSKP